MQSSRPHPRRREAATARLRHLNRRQHAGQEHRRSAMDSLLVDLYQLTILDAYHREGLRGEAVFEPFVRKLPQAQFVESRLLSIVHFQPLIASKAARSVMVAQGRTLVDFGMRCAHGAEAALFATRAACL